MKTYGIDLMVTIANRNRIEKFIQLYREHGMSFNITAFGRGTASSDVLKFLGLDASEKAILFSAVSRTRSREVIRDAILKTRIDVPGNGILMTIPLSAAGGGRSPTIQRHARTMDETAAARTTTCQRYHPSAFSSALGTASDTVSPFTFISDFAYISAHAATTFMSFERRFTHARWQYGGK